MFPLRNVHFNHPLVHLRNYHANIIVQQDDPWRRQTNKTGLKMDLQDDVPQVGVLATCQ